MPHRGSSTRHAHRRNSAAALGHRFGFSFIFYSMRDLRNGKKEGRDKRTCEMERGEAAPLVSFFLSFGTVSWVRNVVSERHFNFDVLVEKRRCLLAVRARQFNFIERIESERNSA